MTQELFWMGGLAINLRDADELSFETNPIAARALSKTCVCVYVAAYTLDSPWSIRK